LAYFGGDEVRAESRLDAIDEPVSEPAPRLTPLVTATTRMLIGINRRRAGFKKATGTRTAM